MKQPTRILIADDHQMFLDGLKLIFAADISYEIVAEAKSGKEVLDKLSEQEIDIAILDVNMPHPNGFETCKFIREHYPACKVIILSMYSEMQFVNEFMKSGALAYVLKNAGTIELHNALRAVSKGEIYISKELKDDSIETHPKDDFVKTLSLTKRELEIIKLLSMEKSSQQIADQLFLSVYTVNTHRKNILQKLGIKNSLGLIKFASDNHLI